MNLHSHLGRRTTVALIAALASGGLSACGSSSAGSTSSGNRSSNPGASVPVAQAALAPYAGHPSAFPVDQPFTKKVASSTKFAFLQCVTPVCGLLSQILAPAVKTMGVQLSVVKAGASAQALQSAMNTIMSQKPAAVMLPAVEPDTINPQLQQLAQMKIPVAANGIMGQQKYGIGAEMFNIPTSLLAGKLLADWVVAKHGAQANVVFYSTPELSFSAYIGSAFGAEMKRLCPACAVRNVVLPVATIGNSAPSRVVSDLQANPSTNVAVFATEEAATGLPSALKGAGIKVDTTGFGPNPVNLQDIKAGGLTSGLGLDFAVMQWTQLDEAARLATGQPLTAGEKKGIPPLQYLEHKDITFDPSNGWTGYPDFPARFAKLWSGKAA